MTPSFTARQGQYLAFIHGYMTRRGYAPSFEDIATHFGTSTPSVNGMIKTLESRGLLKRLPGVARSLTVCVPADELPGGEYGARAAKAVPRPAPAASVVSAMDAAVAAAVAVLEVVTPTARSADAVSKAAEGVRLALLDLGFAEVAAQGVARRIIAQRGAKLR